MSQRKVWNTLFPLQIGTKVKVIKLTESPPAKELLGKTGKIIEVRWGCWFNNMMWFASSHPEQKPFSIYHTEFKDIEYNSYWFPREDLKVI